MWTYNNTSELYHHGILGMKWGHHSSRSSQSKQIHSNNYKKQKELRNKETKILKTPGLIVDGPPKTKISFDPNKELLKKAISVGKPYVDSFLQGYHEQMVINQQQQQQQQRQQQMAIDTANRAAINASLQSASLGLSGGTNPFMFGMM